MFTQRKTNSYDLVGTNARNSDASFGTNYQQQLGESFVERMGFDKSDLSQLDQVFAPFQGNHFLKLNNNEDLVDQILLTRKISNNTHHTRTKSSERGSILGNAYAEPVFGINFCDMPFDLKEQYENLFYAGEESTHDSGFTSQSKGTTSTNMNQFILSANNSDLEEIINNDDKIDKLMQELESIDLPLVQKRLRTKKPNNSKNAKQLILSKSSSIQTDNTEKLSEEEKRRRKNKEQVQILQNEYVRTPNWTRGFMKELAKKTGLKPSQVYKWNWDQKKKEADELKLKRLFYPNEIFQVLDSQGNNIAKPVFKFVINKENNKESQ